MGALTRYKDMHANATEEGEPTTVQLQSVKPQQSNGADVSSHEVESPSTVDLELTESASTGEVPSPITFRLVHPQQTYDVCNSIFTLLCPDSLCFSLHSPLHPIVSLHIAWESLDQEGNQMKLFSLHALNLELWNSRLYFFKMQAAAIMRTWRVSLLMMVGVEGHLLVELVELMREALIHHKMMTMEQERVGKRKGEEGKKMGKKTRREMEEAVAVSTSELGEMGVEVQIMESPVAVRRT